MGLWVSNSCPCGNGCLKKAIAVRYPGIVAEFCAWKFRIITSDCWRIAA